MMIGHKDSFLFVFVNLLFFYQTIINVAFGDLGALTSLYFLSKINGFVKHINISLGNQRFW